jgi:hypothetical protein
MLTLTDEAHQAVAAISRSTVSSHVPGLRLRDRPEFVVRAA